MSVRAYTEAAVVDVIARVITWTGLLVNDTGAPVKVADANVLMGIINSGTLGAAGNIRWQGSIDDGVTYFTLSSDIGTPAAANQTALLTPTMLKERPITVRPNVTGGDGTTVLSASLVAKRFTA